MPVPDEEAFRAEVRGWLAANLAGDFAPLVGSGGPGREHEFVRSGWRGNGCWATAAGSGSAGRKPTAAAACRGATR